MYDLNRVDQLSVQVGIQCEHCGGNGLDPDKLGVACEVCKHTGRRVEWWPMQRLIELISTASSSTPEERE